MQTHCNESHHVSTADGLSVIVIPKLKSDTWSKFKMAIIETLYRTNRRKNMPLSHIISDDGEGNFDATYDSREECLVSCITLSGP